MVNGDFSSLSRVLLRPAQQQAVWEQIIRDSPQGESLLQIPETAEAAMQAWELVHSYRLPLNGQFEASEDCAAFLRWAGKFSDRCESNRWLEEARLADVIGDLIGRGNAQRPSRLFLAGFDEITPQQQALLNDLGAWEELPQRSYGNEPDCLIFRDSSEEMRRAAQWARNLLESDRAAQIGVIVPDLKSTRSKVQRIFRSVLSPGTGFEDPDPAFHLSLGRPLKEYPLVHAALQLLDFAAQPTNLPHIGTLLRSPFLGGALKEGTTRAILDVRLRKYGVWTVTLDSLRDKAVQCPELQRVLGLVQKEVRNLPTVQEASDWSRSFSRILTAYGWPGDRTLNSHEHQVLQAWQRILSEFAMLSAVIPASDCADALERLSELAGSTTFQAENEGSPIQIMGMLEASGLRFEHLWVMGLHDQALPAPARANPFLPLSVRRQMRLPHSSAERELEFADKLLARFLVSAPHVVLSCPSTEGESRLEATPLVPRDRWIVPSEQHDTRNWVASMRAAAKFEVLTDESGPVVPEEAEQRGGTWLFRDMAACPFRAFANYRTGASSLDDAELGLSARDKGKLVHLALALFWGEVKSHQRLCGLRPDELREVVSRSVAGALEQQTSGLGRSLEQTRLTSLLLELMGIERTRSPFTVLEPEAKRRVTVGGIVVGTRVDRIDELPDGRQIMLDYKTGEVDLAGWSGDRLDEPQVPYTASRVKSQLPVPLLCKYAPASWLFVVSTRAGRYRN